MDISFIVPGYNEEKIIGKCLSSIIKEIENNPLIKAEIIVVNNASTDGTKSAALAFSPKVRVIDEPKKGLVFARATGAHEASGKLLAHIDSDCILPSGWLTTVLQEFNQDNKLVALSGPQFYYDVYDQLNFFQKFVVQSYHLVVYWVYWVNRYVLRIGSVLQGGNFIVRDWAWKSIGDASEDISFYGEDTDLCRRLFKIGNVKFTPKLLIYASGRRLKEEGLLKTGGLYVLNYFSILFFKKPFTKKYTDIRIA